MLKGLELLEYEEQYVLTENYVMSNLALSAEKKEALKNDFDIHAREVSDDIYRFIMSNTQISYRYQKIYFLNRYTEWLYALRKAMLYQMRYTLRSGGAYLKDMTGVDLRTARSVNRDNMRLDSHIAPAAIQELENVGALSQNWDYNSWIY